MPSAMTPGSKLGPYEVIELLGAGGMGEVYRARDTRLGRDVAVKVLPQALANDQDRLKRFQREARAAGQLSHPNLMAIFDVGVDEQPYFVCELLEGTDLRARIAQGPLPPKKALAYAIQIARGLAAAHEKGFAHRDLKPENVMITAGDHVKILDFGLAKGLAREAAKDDHTGPILTELTMTGTILGTASYMAPEQIRELPADLRTDIFSLGAILYELLSGKRAFDGASHADRMAAILNSEPAPLDPAIEDALPGIGRVIAHCLEKGPQARFQSASDLAFALELLGGRARATEPAATEAGPRRHTFRRTTYREGSILSARFAADGQAICYGAAWEGRPVELFWAYPGSPESRALGFPRTDLLAIAPSGEMAVSLRRQARGGFVYSGMLARMPVGGGAARELLDSVFEADWSPDGRQLCVVREDQGMTRIEYPMGTPVYRTSGWVSHVRVSPKGDRIGFIDHATRGDDMGSVCSVDLAGEVRTLCTGWSSARGLAWRPDGREIVFTGFRMGVGRSLYAVDLEGNERPILEVPGHMTLLDISPQGSALIVLENERCRLQFQPPDDAPVRDLTWLDWTLVRSLSPDGARLLFDETGVGGGENHATYMRGTDGSPAVRLGDGACLDISPDGQWAVAVITHGTSRLDLLPCGAGSPRTIPLAPMIVHMVAWFPDGEALCVLGEEANEAPRLYRVDSITGRHEPLTDPGISSYDLLVSPDGKRVAARGPDRRFTIFPVDGGTPVPVEGVHENDRVVRWSKDGGAIFVFTRGTLPASVFRVDLATGERKHWKDIAPPAPTGVEGVTMIRMTENEDAYAYSFAQRLNDLYVVEGLF